uniref:Uncharacterized protein n=1 Tax=Rhizophora mucronata TaxID=61149 RepID=A0A2P2K0R1_RHIMU
MTEIWLTKVSCPTLKISDCLQEKSNRRTSKPILGRN